MKALCLSFYRCIFLFSDFFFYSAFPLAVEQLFRQSEARANALAWLFLMCAFYSGVQMLGREFDNCRDRVIDAVYCQTDSENTDNYHGGHYAVGKKRENTVLGKEPILIVVYCVSKS